MFEAMDRMYIDAQIRWNNFWSELKKDETGVSSIVATVLLILIVVLLAAIFWEKIQEWFNTTWEKIVNKGNTIE